MKHNEIKAYYTKLLKKSLPEHTVLSVDESNTTRWLYIVNNESHKTRLYLDCFFGLNQYTISGMLGEGIKVFTVKGYYREMQTLFDSVLQIQEFLSGSVV